MTDVTPIDDETLARLRENHWQHDCDDGGCLQTGECCTCGEDWPCPTAALLARLEAAEGLNHRAYDLLINVDDDTTGPGQGEMWNDAQDEWVGKYERTYPGADARAAREETENE